jgi:hypothetical protein
MTFEELWFEVKDSTVLNRHKVRNLYRLLEKTLASGLDGDVGECGVFKGGVSMMLAKLVQKMAPSKKVFMWDSFEGLPRPDESRDLSIYREGILKASLMDVSNLLRRHDVLDWACLSPGWFEESFERLKPDQKFSFLHIDCDLYDSTMTCLNNLYHRLVPGGIMVFDDYFDVSGGERLAVDEFLLEHGDEQLFAGPVEQVFFIKDRKMVPGESVLWTDRRSISLEYLASDFEYLRDLSKGNIMNELPGGSLKNAARIAAQTLKVEHYHKRVAHQLWWEPTT